MAAQPARASVRAGNRTARRSRIDTSSWNLAPRQRAVAKSLFTHETCYRSVPPNVGDQRPEGEQREPPVRCTALLAGSIAPAPIAEGLAVSHRPFDFNEPKSFVGPVARLVLKERVRAQLLEAASTRPRLHRSDQARPTPELRRSGSTYQPSRNATGLVRHPSTYGRVSASANPHSPPDSREQTKTAASGRTSHAAISASCSAGEWCGHSAQRKRFHSAQSVRSNARTIVTVRASS